MEPFLLIIISFSRFFTLLCSLGFLLGGLYFYRSREASLVNLPFGIGAVLLMIVLLGPLSKGDTVLNNIINSHEIGIDSIKICSLDSRVDSILFDQAVCIRDSLVLNQVAVALNSATNPWFPNFKPPYDWGVLIEMHLSNGGTIPFKCYKKSEKGILEVYSNGVNGWNYGRLVCDELVELLEVNNF